MIKSRNQRGGKFMKITLEMIDELRERKDVSYSEAKAALEQTDGDLVEAIILLEKSNPSQKQPKTGKSILDNIKGFLKKLQNINVIFSKNDQIVIKIPSLIFIITSIILLPFVLVGVVLAVLTNHKIYLSSTDDDVNSVNKVIDDVSNSINKVKDEVKDGFQEEKEEK
jgi:hypothetical protein